MNQIIKIWLIVILSILFFLPTTIVTQTVEGDLIPDFHLAMDTNAIYLDDSNGNMDDFTVTVMNPTIHTLRIRLFMEAPGVSISPQISTVTVTPYGNTDVPAAVATTASHPSGIVGMLVYAELVSADGIPMTGKDRTATVLVIIGQNQNLTCEDKTITIEQGEFIEDSITITNNGNCPDYVTLYNLQSSDYIMGWPGVNFLRLERGEEAEYPIIIGAPWDLEPGTYNISFNVYSRTDGSSEMVGTLTVEVEESSTRGAEERGFLSGWNAMGSLLIGGGIIFLAGFAFVGTFQGNSNRTFSTAGLLRWLTTNDAFRMGGVGRATGGVPCMVVLVMLMGCLIPWDINAAGEIDVTTYGSINIYVSPFRGDTGVGMTEVSITNSDLFEEVTVEVEINSPVGYFGFVKEHRIPPQSTAEFYLYAALPMEDPNRQVSISILARIIEIEAIAFSGGSEAQGGLFLLTHAYTNIKLESTDGQIMVGKNETKQIDIEVTNMGNWDQTFIFDLFNEHRLEDDGLIIDWTNQMMSLATGESGTLSFNVSLDAYFAEKVFVIDLRAAEETLYGDNYWYSIVVVADVPLDEMPNQVPEGRIWSINPDPAYDVDTVTFEAYGWDDGEIVTYHWLSNIDGELYMGPDEEFQFSNLTVGEHEITLYVIDDDGVTSEGDTEILQVLEFEPPNEKPMVSITNPLNGSEVEGTIMIQGIADDNDGDVEKVEISYIEGYWMPASGKKTWNYVLETPFIANGELVIQARSYDGENYSEPVSVTVAIKNVGGNDGEKNDDESVIPGFEPIVLFGVLALVSALRKNRGSQKQKP